MTEILSKYVTKYTRISLYTLHCVGETSVTRIDIVYVYHVFLANRLTGMQMGMFIGETRDYSINVWKIRLDLRGGHMNSCINLFLELKPKTEKRCPVKPGTTVLVTGQQTFLLFRNVYLPMCI